LLTLNIVSGRLQIPKRSEELTVAAVGGNLYIHKTTNISGGVSIKATQLTKGKKNNKYTSGNHRKRQYQARSHSS
jgi:hypothetical protein